MMKLNIKRNREIVKTYEADTYDLMFGTLEDVANAVNFDDLKTGSRDEVRMAVLSLIHNSMDTVKELLRDIFPGITDEDIRCCSVFEIVQVFNDVVMYTIAELGKGFGRKN